MNPCFEFGITRRAHARKQPPVIGGAEPLTGMPGVFPDLAGDFGVEERFDGLDQAGTINSEAVLQRDLKIRCQSSLPGRVC
jgi:hypothetical protein